VENIQSTWGNRIVVRTTNVKEMTALRLDRISYIQSANILNAEGKFLLRMRPAATLKKLNSRSELPKMPRAFGQNSSRRNASTPLAWSEGAS
jgi:hypothetical protein